MNTKDIEKLIELIENSDISEIEFQSKDDKIKIKRGICHEYQASQVSTGQQPYMQPQQPMTYQVTRHEQNQQAQGQQQAPLAPQTPQPSTPAKKAANIAEITSPFVGTFYRAPSPDSEPFIQVGDRVKKGDTLCIVEAMKLMNEIEAEFNGVVSEILIENAQPVEYGEILFHIERS